MILATVVRVDDPDISRYAWSRLRRFRNIPEVEERVVRRHDLDGGQRPNARKQATQIRHCLIQAQEYFEAASAVSLATKPVLFYYCIMSLALAEVLLKQSGMSSLDRAREQNKHHGLALRVHSAPKEDYKLRESAASLVAAPLICSSGEGFGTFALWHQSCRGMPLAGAMKCYPANGGLSTSLEIILAPHDIPLRSLPPEGISLLECMRNIPGMMSAVGQFGIEPNIIRARVERSSREKDETVKYELVIHPGVAPAIGNFLDNLLFHPADALDRLRFKEMHSGGIIQWEDPPGEHMGVSIPNGTTWTSGEVRFWPCDQPLNEFGFIYIALYIARNYARYFPDLWMRDVERSSPLALVIEELLAMAARRMPLLALSELSGIYYVPAA